MYAKLKTTSKRQLGQPNPLHWFTLSPILATLSLSPEVVQRERERERELRTLSL
jgi:hypothetical protein